MVRNRSLTDSRLGPGAKAAGLAVTAAALALASSACGAAGAGSDSPRAGTSVTGGARITVPRPDHVVVVVEENRAYSDIIGNTADAPYLNLLARQGASFDQSFGVTHPSEPNYLALFSGSAQGVTDDSCPHSFAAANLGSELIASGLSFGGYAESMPTAGYTGCNSGGYARRHNPWVNFADVPATSNLPWSAFPRDYANLPTVSFVVPNVQNDMHDGSVRQGDAWLRQNLGGYATWAQTHNSLLVITWDEDDGNQRNQIPTILLGQQVQPGTYSETVDHYRLLNTLEHAYSLAPTGHSAATSPITDVWRRP